MKPIVSILSLSFYTVFICFTVIGLTQCSSASTSEGTYKSDSESAESEKVRKEIQDEKQAIREDIQRSRDQIEKRISELEAKAEKANEKTKKNVDEEIKRLERDREHLIVMNEELETTNAEDLAVFRKNVQDMFTEIESDLKNFTADIEKAIE